MALLTGITLEGESVQKLVSSKSIVSPASPKTVSFVSPSLPETARSNHRKTVKLEIKKLPLVKLFEGPGLDRGQISGWTKDKDAGVSVKGNATPDWIK